MLAVLSLSPRGEPSYGRPLLSSSVLFSHLLPSPSLPSLFFLLSAQHFWSSCLGLLPGVAMVLLSVSWGAVTLFASSSSVAWMGRWPAV